ncbi:hypothetical protein [Telluribacter sp. SYSU D00476]|uniref:hypothetical protein n=1 Tax=Telluribacter sp. SYSU D00476 TaxID=2811430 RepID=UPI001FF34767|nr:hypothetical protein [Telluribacter sp. SYSU D00476]
MQRRHSSASILLYGFGLALALSLVFNGYLLYNLIRQRSLYVAGLRISHQQADNKAFQQQLSDCKWAIGQKDSLIRHLEQVSHAPPEKVD